jgi:hypothetical protein
MPTGVYPRTAEQYRKIGEANRHHLTGGKLSDEHKAKIRATAKISGEKKKLLVGPLAPGWKDGRSAEDKRQRSIFTRTIKPLVLLRDNYTCQRCHTKDGKMHVDHIQSWKDFKHFAVRDKQLSDFVHGLSLPHHLQSAHPGGHNLD